MSRLIDLEDLQGYGFDELKGFQEELFDAVLEKVKNDKRPYLGLATTRQLLNELRARIEVDGKLDYRTVDKS